MNTPTPRCSDEPAACQASVEASANPLYREYIAAMALELARMARSRDTGDERLADLLDRASRAATSPRRTKSARRKSARQQAGPTGEAQLQQGT